ncbi:MAG: hypothetical protein ACKO3T_26340 [Planctomycetaceae bacterium]
MVAMGDETIDGSIATQLMNTSRVSRKPDSNSPFLREFLLNGVRQNGSGLFVAAMRPYYHQT